jgi:hypothetical protein
LAVGEVALNSSFFLPTKTYFDFKDVDPLSSLIGFLAKQPAGVSMAIQILVTPAYFNWQDKAVEQAGKMHYDLRPIVTHKTLKRC